MYIEREIESTVDAMLRQGKVVLVTGARQVGKTTMLRRHLGDSFAYATMDWQPFCGQIFQRVRPANLNSTGLM